MVNTTFNSTEDMMIKLQSSKGKIKLKFYKNIINYDEMKIEDEAVIFIFKKILLVKMFKVLEKFILKFCC